MKKTTLALVMAGLMMATIFGACFTVNADPLPPKSPAKPIGPTHLQPECGPRTYIFKTINPIKDSVYYIVDWGDGSQDETDECNPAVGTTLTNDFHGTDGSTFSIRAKAVDSETGIESGWSPSLTVSIGKSKSLERFPAILRLLDIFPMFLRLRSLLGL